MEGIEDKVERLDRQVSSLSNAGKVIGIVGVIFGLAGSWGYTVLSEARAQIVDLREELQAADQYFEQLRSEEEAKLEEFVAERRLELMEVPTWPAAAFCVAKSGRSCPGGFEEGRIYLDTEDSNPKNTWSGKLPAFEYQKSNITMVFCCRAESN